MTIISSKKLFELTADTPAGQMADAFKKWVANIASQYCQPILPFHKLWSCWMPTSDHYHCQTGKHLKQARENQSTHHIFPKQHKIPPLKIINPDSANAITANFHKEYETLFFSYPDKTILHTHEITKSRLSVALLALDTTLCGRPESSFEIRHVYDHFISRTNITHELLLWKQEKKKWDSHFVEGMGTRVAR